ncbi:MAG: hypothetical protein ACFFKA_00045 [Candidatus Thorarchaeota archaeon]
MITEVNASLEGETVLNIKAKSAEYSIGESVVDGFKLDEIKFSGVIRTQEDISKLKNFLTIARTCIK